MNLSNRRRLDKDKILTPSLKIKSKSVVCLQSKYILSLFFLNSFYSLKCNHTFTFTILSRAPLPNQDLLFLPFTSHIQNCISGDDNTILPKDFTNLVLRWRWWSRTHLASSLPLDLATVNAMGNELLFVFSFSMEQISKSSCLVDGGIMIEMVHHRLKVSRSCWDFFVF